jgi:ATP-dependent Clp protease ATP-binding subunit ClpB
MTSNVGSQMIQEITATGGSENEIRSAVQEALQTRFLPEFLNRIDDTIIFHPLRREEIHKIALMQVDRLTKQLEHAGLQLDVTPAAIAALAEQGYDPSMGARPLRRVIQQQVQNPLATEILKGEFGENGARRVVQVDFRGGEFVFAPGEAVTA